MLEILMTLVIFPLYFTFNLQSEQCLTKQVFQYIYALNLLNVFFNDSDNCRMLTDNLNIRSNFMIANITQTENSF